MILVDSNIILDVLTCDPVWQQWSSEKLAEFAETGGLVINDMIYAEISIGFARIEELEEALSGGFFKLAPIPKEALFLAGKAFLQYKSQQGSKTSTLPDFFIGAHAAVQQMPLLTRDSARYKTYFPSVKVICP